MTDRPQVLLRLEQHTIPALIAAFDQAIDQMTPLLWEVKRGGRLTEPWLHDDVSAGVADWYNWLVMGDGDGEGRSAYARLRAYEAELIKVRDTLRAMDAEYGRTEDERTDLFRQRA